MKFNIGDHLQQIDNPYHGYVTDIGESSINNNDETWYEINSKPENKISGQ
jgi:heat shock protein HspQ